MKRLMKLMVVVGVALTPLFSAGQVAAQQATCEVGFTGPNSNNQCVSTTTYDCSVSNENVVTVNTGNEQTAATGTATGSGATSGSATNSNGTNFVFTITNERVCTAVVTVPPTQTPETPVVTTTSGGGAVEALPKTSSDTTLQTVAIVAGALILIAGLSVGGVLWYRHSKV